MLETAGIGDGGDEIWDTAEQSDRSDKIRLVGYRESNQKGCFMPHFILYLQQQLLCCSRVEEISTTMMGMVICPFRMRSRLW